MPKVISLFSGAGGLDFGLEAAGFTFGAGVEMDADCVSTLLESRPDWPVVAESIFDVPTQELLDRAGSKKGDIDLVAGGPPCQPFSKAGYWARGDAGRLSDPRSDTLGAYLRVVREALPKVLLLENVEGLKYAGKDEGLQLLLSELGGDQQGRADILCASRRRSQRGRFRRPAVARARVCRGSSRGPAVQIPVADAFS